MQGELDLILQRLMESVRHYPQHSIHVITLDLLAMLEIDHVWFGGANYGVGDLIMPHIKNVIIHEAELVISMLSIAVKIIMLQDVVILSRFEEHLIDENYVGVTVFNLPKSEISLLVNQHCL